MNIVHISTSDIKGGAAKSAYRLHAGLQKISQKSQILVANKFSDDDKVLLYKINPVNRSANKYGWNIRGSLLKALKRLSNIEPDPRDLPYYSAQRPKGYGPFSTTINPQYRDIHAVLPDCDIVNLHWIARFLDYRSFFSNIPTNYSMVWTLHDMNALTGGCHYDYLCGKYNSGCGACPQLGSKETNDLSRQIWQQKREIYSSIDPRHLHLITPSNWLADLCRNSKLLGRFPVLVIPYGLDLKDFAPRDRGFAREVLGIPINAKVLMFIADSLNSHRKGFQILADILPRLHKVKSLLLLSVGNGKPEINIDSPHFHLGHISNERLLSLVYSAADIYLIPSLQDNLPNTVLEAMACGTPTVGFESGGIADMIQSGLNGYLVRPKDTGKMIDIIENLVSNNSDRLQMTSACRKIAVDNYADIECARQYLNFYKTLK